MLGAIYQFLLSFLTQLLAWVGISFGTNSAVVSDPSASASASASSSASASEELKDGMEALNEQTDAPPSN